MSAPPGAAATESLHGVSANVVGFLAVVALLVTGVMGGEE